MEIEEMDFDGRFCQMEGGTRAGIKHGGMVFAVGLYVSCENSVALTPDRHNIADIGCWITEFAAIGESVADDSPDEESLSVDADNAEGLQQGRSTVDLVEQALSEIASWLTIMGAGHCRFRGRYRRQSC